MVAEHKARSVFDRYNIFNDDELREVKQRQDVYLLVPCLRNPLPDSAV